eukprot:2909540-Prymnesium_polylepis.2
MDGDSLSHRQGTCTLRSVQDAAVANLELDEGVLGRRGQLFFALGSHGSDNLDERLARRRHGRNGGCGRWPAGLIACQSPRPLTIQEDGCAQQGGGKDACRRASGAPELDVLHDLSRRPRRSRPRCLGAAVRPLARDAAPALAVMLAPLEAADHADVVRFACTLADPAHRARVAPLRRRALANGRPFPQRRSTIVGPGRRLRRGRDGGAFKGLALGASAAGGGRLAQPILAVVGIGAVVGGAAAFDRRRRALLVPW